MAEEQNVDRDRIVVSHQDLGESEWQGTTDLVRQQAKLFGLQLFISDRVNKDGYHETFLEYAERRGKWPSGGQRWCTSDFKRGPGARIVTALTSQMPVSNVLYVFGFRKAESRGRAKKPVIEVNKTLTTKSRTVLNYLPIHEWSDAKVWRTIKDNNLPYHEAYDLGMPRLSCVFCIFAGFDALVVAGKANPELLQKYVDVEERIDHTFTTKFSLKDVQNAIRDNYKPQKIKSWTM